MKYICTFSMLVILLSCKSKQQQASDPADFVPVSTFLEGQIAQIDSSMGTILKIQRTNGKSDTSFISRSEFKQQASPFVQIPEISLVKLRDEYEAASMYDELLQAFVFTYTSRDPENEIIRQDVIVAPAGDGTNIIQAVTIRRNVKRGKDYVQQTLLWEADKRFVIVDQGANEQLASSVEVKWNNLPPGYSQ